MYLPSLTSLLLLPAFPYLHDLSVVGHVLQEGLPPGRHVDLIRPFHKSLVSALNDFPGIFILAKGIWHRLGKLLSEFGAAFAVSEQKRDCASR